MRQSRYSSRNESIHWRRQWFTGNHWATMEVEDEEERDAILVFNYVRNIVLRYAATMVRHARPRVPIPIKGSKIEKDRANNRERYLLAVWPALKKAWRDVELNASKCSFGVLQVLWDPPEAEEVTLTEGEAERTEKRYLEPPYKFRSLKSEHFYPTYRTFDDPNDFIYVHHIEPNRLVSDLELKYGVELMASGLDTETESGVIGTEPTCEVIAYWDKKIYALIAITHVLSVVGDKRGRDRGEPEVEYVENFALLEYTEDHGLGRIPFWVLQNIRNPDYDPTKGGSISDIDDIAELNRHYNWIVSEESDEITTHIHRPTYYASDEHMQDPGAMIFKPGAVIPIGKEEDVWTLDWKPEPGYVSGHLDRIQASIKELSFLSEAGFGQLPAGVSGVAAKVALTPMEQIIELKLPQRQETLESVCKYLLRLYEKHGKADTKFHGWVSSVYSKHGEVVFGVNDIQGQYYVTVDYGNMLPRDDEAYDQNETYKYKTGVQSLTDTIERLGGDDAASKLEQIKEELMDPELNPDHVIKVIEAKQRLKELEMMAAAPTMPTGGMEAGMPGASMPGTAQDGTRPVQTGAPMAGAPEAPPVPNANVFGRSEAEGEMGAGAVTPYLPRQVAGGQALPGPGAM